MMDPRPPRVDPELILFPQARKKARCAGPGIRSQVAELNPANCVQRSASLPPRISMDGPRPFDRYDADTWTEVAKHLCGRDLLCLSGTSRWFRRFVAEDTLWRYAFFHDFNLAAANPHIARPPNRSWRHLYLAAFNGSHAYFFRQNDKHIGFLLDCPDLLLCANLLLPMWPPLYYSKGVKHDIETMGVCVMTDARPGVWIADFHRVRCPGCQFKSCQGETVDADKHFRVLDARHSDLFLEKAYRDGTLEYEDLGQHLHDKKASAASCAVLSLKHLASPSTTCVLDTGAWTSSSTKGDESGALDFKMIITTYAAAISNCNLCHNEGLQSCFQAMRDTAGDGKIVSVRISQLLL